MYGYKYLDRVFGVGLLLIGLFVLFMFTLSPLLAIVLIIITIVEMFYTLLFIGGILENKHIEDGD